jgi:hypothetical protein
MATLTGPLLSFSARKSIGKTLVYSSWKGIPYSRQHVIPANPNTADQQEVRNVFAWLQRVWAYAPALATEGWDAYASGQPMTGRNAFAKFNVGPLQGETTLANFIMSPAAKSGPVAAGATFTGGALQITAAITAPSLPSGWTIYSGIAACIPEQNPQSGQLFSIVAGEDLSSTYEVILTGLTAATTYVCGAWFKYNRPDGSFAYGPALQANEATT